MADLELSQIEHQFMTDRWVWAHMLYADPGEGEPRGEHKYLEVKDSVIEARRTTLLRLMVEAEETVTKWCDELLMNATGNRCPYGHTANEEEYKWYGWGSSGYRNNDTVNSMLAFWYKNRDKFDLRNDEGVNEYVKAYNLWLRETIDDYDDLDACFAKRDVVLPYICDWTYMYACNIRTPEYIVYDKCCSTNYTKDMESKMFEYGRMRFVADELDKALKERKRIREEKEGNQ